MEANEFGLVEKILSFNPVTKTYAGPAETFEARYTVPLHDVKSAAGHDFQKGYVESVCVYDRTGKVRLYLRKDKNGRCIKREVND